jgi:hypothetical protein
MIEIPDDMVERAIEAGAYFSSAESRKHFRTILQAALNKRVGEADRRKVNDEFQRQLVSLAAIVMTGRRSTDVVDYDDLPIATEPEIPAERGDDCRQTVAIQHGLIGKSRPEKTRHDCRDLPRNGIKEARGGGGTPFVHFRRVRR